jgi:hypothetical protein
MSRTSVDVSSNAALDCGLLTIAIQGMRVAVDLQFS